MVMILKIERRIIDALVLRVKHFFAPPAFPQASAPFFRGVVVFGLSFFNVNLTLCEHALNAGVLGLVNNELFE